MKEKKSLLKSILGHNNNITLRFEHQDNNFSFYEKELIIHHDNHKFNCLINSSLTSEWFPQYRKLQNLFCEAINFLIDQIENYQINIILNSEGMKEFKGEKVIPEIEIKVPNENGLVLNFKKMLGLAVEPQAAKGKKIR